MNLADEILREHSRAQASRIAAWVGNDRGRFRRLMALFLKGDYRITQRAAWPVGLCAERHPALIRPWLRRMVERMQEPGTHDAVRRNVVRILQFTDIPQSLVGPLANICFTYLSSADQPIAVKVFSMTVLGRIAAKEPDLVRELRLVIEQQLPYGSAGFRARARMVLKSLPASG